MIGNALEYSQRTLSNSSIQVKSTCTFSDIKIQLVSGKNSMRVHHTFSSYWSFSSLGTEKVANHFRHLDGGNYMHIRDQCMAFHIKSGDILYDTGIRF